MEGEREGEDGGPLSMKGGGEVYSQLEERERGLLA